MVNYETESANNCSNSSGMNWKHIHDLQGWKQKIKQTKENDSNNFSFGELRNSMQNVLTVTN